VIGINTARSLTWKDGRISEAQIAAIHGRLDGLPGAVTKVVVTHHPFDLPDGARSRELVGRADQAMALFARCGVDLLLAGHFHTTHAGDTSDRYPLDNYSALVVQAGTATSTRGRGEANSCNVIRTQAGEIAVEPWNWLPQEGRFVATPARRFMRVDACWQPLN